ncbi:MAG TPA: hypothetical protein VFF76_00405 [Holophagaceae bacterium]|jgi:hypothetical protein|nr:hypothetical protein [Holophagaceae bacterium]
MRLISVDTYPKPKNGAWGSCTYEFEDSACVTVPLSDERLRAIANITVIAFMEELGKGEDVTKPSPRRKRA